MPESLPYLASPGSIKNALERIRQAATPDRVTQDFVATVLNIKGGTGAAIIPYLKKIGLVASDGTPTALYKKFRNPTAGGAAIAAAIKTGYKKLAESSEYFYLLNDKELQALIVQVTGAEADSPVVKLALSTLKTVKSFANFDKEAELDSALEVAGPPSSGATNPPREIPPQLPTTLGLNLSYTINLNLPATADQAVFNAIFRSLKEHLLSHAEQ
jgi:Family of unknown function (DUF5343)